MRLSKLEMKFPKIEIKFPKLKSYWLVSVILSLLAVLLIYIATIKVSPPAKEIPKGYFFLVLILIIGFQFALISFSTRITKVVNRNFDKALLSASGISFLNGFFSYASLPFTESKKAIAVILSLISGVLSWFLLKKVYEIPHKVVIRMILWMVFIVSVLAIIAVFIGGIVLKSKLGYSF